MHSAGGGVAILEILLPAVPALEVLVLGLGLGGLLLREVVADRLQLFLLLSPHAVVSGCITNECMDGNH